MKKRSNIRTSQNASEEQLKTLSKEELSQLQGQITIPMTNDYLFRALLQRNNQVLKALICSLLHFDSKQVHTVSIENPIELGKSYGEKDLILDIKALLDGNVIINLEMQVVNWHNWPDRSLYYLCSSFVNLDKGKEYSQVKPTIQIGFLNFSLFPNSPEFYSNYYMMNEKTYQKYSDKLRLTVVDLTQIDLATKEDRAYGIDQWARFFKGKDWRELAMLAKENPDIQAAVGTVYQLTREQQIRQQCEAREDYYRRETERQRELRWIEENKQINNEILKKIIRFRRENKQVSQELTKLRQDLAKDQQDLAKDQQDLAKNQQDLAKGQQILAKGQQDLAKDQQDLEQARQEIDQGRQELDQDRQELSTREQKIKEKELELKRIERELQEKQQQLNTIQENSRINEKR